MMNTDINEAGRLPPTPKPCPGPRYNLLSVAAPFLGVLAVLVFMGIVGTEGHWYWTWRGGAAMGILASACVVGVVFAFVALARSERLWGLTALGFFLNAPLPLLLLWQGLSLLDTWL